MTTEDKSKEDKTKEEDAKGNVEDNKSVVEVEGIVQGEGTAPASPEKPDVADKEANKGADKQADKEADGQCDPVYYGSV